MSSDVKKKYGILANEKIIVFKTLTVNERKCGHCGTRMPMIANVCPACGSGQN